MKGLFLFRYFYCGKLILEYLRGRANKQMESEKKRIKAGLKCSFMAKTTIEFCFKTKWNDRRCISSQIMVTIEIGQSCQFNFAK